jgi:hypothetical protein
MCYYPGEVIISNFKILDEVLKVWKEEYYRVFKMELQV